MKFIHLSDLHIGKRINEFSMIEDQKYILKKILNIIDTQKPDGVIIAGDVYDKSVPSAEAVAVFDDFIVKLKSKNMHTFIISGNHDSAERLAFGGRIMDMEGIHFSPVYNGKISPITLTDKYGNVNLYMLPFIKPAHVTFFFPDEKITSYTDAVSTVIRSMNIDTNQRNILITHQFVTGAYRSESEDISLGGSDNVDGSIFKDFDYTALGHIHGPQNVGSEKIRYCGTPLKYSFSEANHKKSVTVIEFFEKGNISLETIPLEPLRDMVEIKGKYEEITLKSFYENTSYMHDYVHITLTDEEDIPDAISRLRVIYKNLMKLDYDNTRTRHEAEVSANDDIERKTPAELFGDFYQMQNGVPMSQTQADFIKDVIEKIWEEEE